MEAFFFWAACRLKLPLSADDALDLLLPDGLFQENLF